MAKDKILALAEELASQLAQSDEYQSLKKAEAELDAHAAAKIMWQDLRKKQQACQEAGLSQEDLKTRFEELQKTYELVSHNPYIRNYLMAQMELGQLWSEIQKLLAEAIGIKMEEQGESQDEESKENPL